ncbi:excinuclease ABC subunit UvrA [Paenibacillaceae bacterium]|nr:excinuclease ABC subunit UvrA [Paenibacillaceae bacterium]
MDKIQIRKVRLHHLKSVDVDIPKGKLVVFTGVSGSGKSSLAFDLLFEEGRKRYLQSIGLQNNGNQLNEEEPFDEINGLPPTIAVAQNTIRQTNTRSTVGTKTKAIDLLCRLFALEGTDAEECLTDLGPSHFSYNRVEGMCSHCFGRGYNMEIDISRLISNADSTLEKICAKQFAQPLVRQLAGFGAAVEADWKKGAYKDLNESQKKQFLYGLPGIFKGLFPYIEEKMQSTPLQRVLGEKRHCSKTTCMVCNGYRVNEAAQRITVSGLHIGQWLQMSVAEWEKPLTELMEKNGIRADSLKVLKRLSHLSKKLCEVGLSYLTFVRSVPSLSGGELQRLFIMLHLESDFDSLLYIFDEPTAGLHESERGMIRKRIQRLTNAGNTVIVVEHDKEFIRSAEYAVELGPGPGKNGGNILYAGSPQGLSHCPDSVVGPYLSGARIFTLPSTPGIETVCSWMTIRNATLHNLNNVTVRLPLGVMVGVAGMSGSGKSTLITGTLVPLLQHCFDIGGEEAEESPDEEEEEGGGLLQGLGTLEGWEQINKCVIVSQAPIGRSRMSTPVTYIGIWDKLRKIFAEQPEAIAREFTPSHFSFNTENGACTACKGEGALTVDLGPIGMMTRECPACQGSRYKAEILEVKVKGQSISDVLQASVEDVIEWFVDHKSIVTMLKMMEQVGLGYLSLGQPAPTLSGGEAQRLKLAKELGKPIKPGTLYVLDEPATGLGEPDVEKLLSLLSQLVNQGGTVILTEHKAAVLSRCDWIIEMGPYGGIGGGSLIAEGTPAELATNPHSLIGPYLK